MSATSSFDDRAQTWDADPVKQERAEAVATVLRQRVPLSPAWQALEYVCGTGLLSFVLYADLGRITLADSSPGMLAVLDRKIAAAGLMHLHPLALDLLTDPLPAERYDLLYTLMALHHVADVGWQLVEHGGDRVERPEPAAFGPLHPRRRHADSRSSRLGAGAQHRSPASQLAFHHPRCSH